jgi:replicative DNA helicase
MATARVDPPPPVLSDLDAEEALLGSLWLDPGELLNLEQPLTPDDFESHKNGVLFGLFQRHGEGAREDAVILSPEAQEAGWTLSDLVQLSCRVPTSSHARFYAAKVLHYAELRRLVEAATRTVAMAYQSDAEPQTVWQSGRDRLDAAIGQRTDKAALNLKDSLTAYYDVLGEGVGAKHKPVIRLPWQAISWYIPRLPGGTVTVVGANSSVGKTAFMECCAEEWAQAGFNIVFFHFELSHAIMLDRRMARQSGVGIDRLQSGDLGDGEAGFVAEATDRISSWPGDLTLAHCPGWTMPMVALKVRQLATRNPVDAVVVDYLQKAAFHQYERGLTPAQMRGQDVETLKILAEELDVPVVLGSQMNRQAQGVEHKTRHQLRDTGEADEKGNIVLILDREILEKDLGVFKAGEYSPEVSVRIDKNTLGKTGKTTLILDGPRFKLGDLVKG